MSVEKTFETGENQENVTAVLKKTFADGKMAEKRLKVFTIKKDDVIFLRLEKI